MIRTESGGYVLDVDPDQVDALRFTRLVTAAVAAQPAAAQDRFSEALAPLQRLGNLDATAEVPGRRRVSCRRRTRPGRRRRASSAPTTG